MMAARTTTRVPVRREMLKAEILAEVTPMIQAITADRAATALQAKKQEDVRAGKRNRNRLYMLMFTIFFSLFAATIFKVMGWTGMMPYIAPVSFAPDVLLCLWAWWRKL